MVNLDERRYRKINGFIEVLYTVRRYNSTEPVILVLSQESYKLSFVKYSETDHKNKEITGTILERKIFLLLSHEFQDNLHHEQKNIST